MARKKDKKKVVVIEKVRGQPDKVKVQESGPEKPKPTISQVDQEVPVKQARVQGQPVRISPKWQKLQ